MFIEVIFLKKWSIVLIILICLVVSVAGVSASQKVDVVALGDSNTENVNWEEYNYDESEKWVTLLSKRTGFTIANEGVGGDSSKKGKWRFYTDVLIRQPDKVLIMFGTNDAIMTSESTPQVSKREFEENLQSIIDDSFRIGGIPLLMTSVPMVEGDNTKYYYSRHNPELYAEYGGARNWHDSYNDIVRDLAKKNNLQLIDIWKSFINEAGGNDDQLLIKSELMDDSGTHMTPKGAKLVYETIMQSSVFE